MASKQNIVDAVTALTSLWSRWAVPDATAHTKATLCGSLSVPDLLSVASQAIEEQYANDGDTPSGLAMGTYTNMPLYAAKAMAKYAHMYQTQTALVWDGCTSSTPEGADRRFEIQFGCRFNPYSTTQYAVEWIKVIAEGEAAIRAVRVALEDANLQFDLSHSEDGPAVFLLSQ